MSVPVTGVIILIVAAYLFLFAPRYLYPALIISIPFSATAVVNFAWSREATGGTEKSLMAWQLLAGLWVIREALSGAPLWHRRGWFLTQRARWMLLFFLAALIGSWCLPIVLNGTSWVSSWRIAPLLGGAASTERVALRLTSYDLTQTAYIAIGVLIIVFVAAENCRPGRLLHTLRLYVMSCLLAATWGLFQLACFISGTAYPAQIFNTSTSLTATLGDKQTLRLGHLILGRISSVALEPSMFAEELLFAFVILIVCIGAGFPILSRRWNVPAALLLLVGLASSSSTTAYVGILAALIFASVTLARAGNRNWRRYPAVAVVLMVAAGVLLMQVPLIHDLADAAFVTKFHNGIGGTGNDRLTADAVAAKVFIQHPILGAGWHKVDCYDISLLLLANLGVVGFAAFLSFLLPVLRRLWRLTRLQCFPAMLLLPAVGLSLFLAEGSGLSLIPVNWLALGLAVGAAVGPGMKVRTALAVDREGETTFRPSGRGANGLATDAPAL